MRFGSVVRGEKSLTSGCDVNKSAPDSAGDDVIVDLDKVADPRVNDQSGQLLTFFRTRRRRRKNVSF